MTAAASGFSGFLTIDEAAALLKVSRYTLYRWCAAGKAPHLRLGKQLRFEAAALAAWVRDGGPGA